MNPTLATSEVGAKALETSVLEHSKSDKNKEISSLTDTPNEINEKKHLIIVSDCCD